MQSAPAVLAERVFEEAGDLPMPPQDLPADFIAAAPEFAAQPSALDPLRSRRAARARRAAGRAPAQPPGQPRRRPRQDRAGGLPARRRGARARSAAPGQGARLVQLGAFDSEEITREAWAQLVARHGDLLGAKSLYVERTTANARVFYRLRVAGFADAEETRAMCEALRARSIDCIPVTLQ